MSDPDYSKPPNYGGPPPSVQAMLDGGASATLERRVYARIDDVLGPVNVELDAVNTRLENFAAQYEALAKSVQRVAISAPTSEEFKSVVTRLEAAAIRATDAHRRCDVIASVNARNDTGISALRSALEQQAQYQVSLATRLDDVGDLGLEPLGEKIEGLQGVVQQVMARQDRHAELIEHQTARIDALSSSIEDHVHKADGAATPPRADDASTHVALAAKLLGGDTYEVDGRPATRAEYEAAERDAARAHTTHHVHRPFSDGTHSAESRRGNPEQSPEVRDIGWAMRQLAAGHKVRMGRWTHGTYWMCSDDLGSVERYIHDGAKKPEIGLPYLCKMYLDATDWEIAP